MKQTFAVFFVLYAISLGAQDLLDASKSNSFQLDLGANQLKEENLYSKVHTGLLYGLIC